MQDFQAHPLEAFTKPLAHLVGSRVPRDRGRSERASLGKRTSRPFMGRTWIVHGTDETSVLPVIALAMKVLPTFQPFNLSTYRGNCKTTEYTEHTERNPPVSFAFPCIPWFNKKLCQRFCNWLIRTSLFRVLCVLFGKRKKERYYSTAIFRFDHRGRRDFRFVCSANYSKMSIDGNLHP